MNLSLFEALIFPALLLVPAAAICLFNIVTQPLTEPRADAGQPERVS